MRHISFNLIKALRVSGVVLLVGFIAVYAYNNTRLLSRGVPLEIYYPRGDEGILQTETIRIEGNVKNAKHLDINGRSLVINEEGEFSDTLILLPGINPITVIARDRFENQSQKNINIIYKPEDSIVAEEDPPPNTEPEIITTEELEEV